MLEPQKKEVNMIDWILENKEWLFSGVAIATPIAIITWLFTRKSKSVRQSQKSGKNSLNIQVGGDLKIKDDND